MKTKEKSRLSSEKEKTLSGRVESVCRLTFYIFILKFILIYRSMF
jgi:hypothetical protein